jgi:hypothetical protein
MFKKRESIEENISTVMKPVSRQLSSNEASAKSRNRVYFSSKIVDAFQREKAREEFRVKSIKFKNQGVM